MQSSSSSGSDFLSPTGAEAVVAVVAVVVLLLLLLPSVSF
jgi:hypothetical protein